MKVSLIAIGTKMPSWVQQGVEEYQKRIQSKLKFNLIEVPLARRSKSQSIEQCIQKEGNELLKMVPPDSWVIALDVAGTSISTEQLARKLTTFMAEGQNISLLIGGPDGLDRSCLDKSKERWSFSALTLPHPLVRILVIEQLYRAFSMLNGHPYHRD
ncbi:MAG: 23S rRNA (pseudouridine(1915)-N(3))-methyltransferase RlmH [Pseudomonadota bacterium]|nr:23S rRNA (pseudouridine(1915)-N(3))-methyltransferase RlmH [Pseudomonadota bacterium]